MTEEVKKKFISRDRCINVLSNNGKFRAVAVRNTRTVQMAQQNHGLDQVAAFYLAKTMTATTMMSAFLKGEERIIVDITSDGIINKIYAESLQVGENRGFVQVSDKKTNKVLTLSDILGKGMLKVSRILYNQIEPITGIIPLQKGDIDSDIASYFSQSEQIASAVLLDVDFDEQDNITCSGGILVQAMPDATESEIDEVVSAISDIGTICSELEQHISLEELLLHHLPFEFSVVNSKPIDFFCRCNLKNFKSHLQLLALKEIESMQELGQNELVCQYCNKHYYLTNEDFAEIIGQIKARNN